MKGTFHIRDLRAGQSFTEVDCGLSADFVALEDAHEVHEEYRKGWECRGRLIRGTAGRADPEDIVTFFEAFDVGAYGLRLYPIL